MLTKKYKKSDTRLLPLFAVEYWYLAENKILPKITNNLAKYYPLFVYSPGKGVDVYYQLKDWDIEDNILSPYFQKYKLKFKKLIDEYQKECIEIKSNINNKNIFNLLISAWAKLSFIVPLGELYYSGTKNIVTQKALAVRQKTINDFYKTNKNIISNLENILPKYNKYLNFLTINEIKNNKLIVLSELKKRKNAYIFYKNNIYTNITFKKFIKENNILIKSEKSISNKTNKTILTGITAMNGKVNGYAKVILHQDQMKLIKKGDILVTPMTTTNDECMLAIGRAGAIITDEGGMTSHAAIIAREMKKPCIMATKIATKLLKNNDYIEVDADNGIIKIIN